LSQTSITFYRIQFTSVLLMVTRGVHRQGWPNLAKNQQ
jgi:hypothetical protein